MNTINSANCDLRYFHSQENCEEQTNRRKQASTEHGRISDYSGFGGRRNS